MSRKSSSPSDELWERRKFVLTLAKTASAGVLLSTPFISHANDPGYDYDLNWNNCANFAINALGAAGIALPARQGSWPGGKGFDPGDFGEDIRAMTLAPNMTRNTAFNDHPNLGNCY